MLSLCWWIKSCLYILNFVLILTYMLCSLTLMDHFSAPLALEVPIIIEFEFVSSLHILFSSHFQPYHDLLHIGYVSPSETYLKHVMEIVLIHWPIIFKHCPLESLPFLVPYPTLRLGFNLAANELMLVNTIFGKLTLTKSTFNSFLLISWKLFCIKLLGWRREFVALILGQSYSKLIISQKH